MLCQDGHLSGTHKLSFGVGAVTHWVYGSTHKRVLLQSHSIWTLIKYELAPYLNSLGSIISQCAWPLLRRGFITNQDLFLNLTISVQCLNIQSKHTKV